MLHLLAFGASTPGVLTDSILNAIPDPIFTRSNNRFQVPTPLKLLLGYAASISLTGARVNTASLRLRGFPQITPTNITALPPSDPNVLDMREWPLDLRPEEDIELDVTRVAGGGAENTYGGLWVCQNEPVYNINYRDLRWIRFTAAVTQVAFNWSAAATVAFQDTLEGGRYAIFGMQCNSTSTVFARLILQNQVYRPGILGQTLVSSRSHEAFRGGLGLWGFFNTYSVPQIESVGDAAGAETIEGRMLIAKA
jgi:hypothetical protein